MTTDDRVPPMPFCDNQGSIYARDFSKRYPARAECPYCNRTDVLLLRSGYLRRHRLPRASLLEGSPCLIR